jgi:sarcosine oxidase
VLVDPGGGVIDAAAVGEYLIRRVGKNLVGRAVHRIEPAGDRVRLDGAVFDSCVIVAGAATAALAGQVGLRVPTRLAHHCRFTFALADPAARPPCLLERSGAWQPGFTTYQHLTAPGKWAVGAHLPDTPLGVDQVSKDSAIAVARQATADYVRENLPGVTAEPVEALYCDSLQSGDGYQVQRAGAVLSLHGDNLFKLAPILGEQLAAAAVTGSTPASVRS